VDGDGETLAPVSVEPSRCSPARLCFFLSCLLPGSEAATATDGEADGFTLGPGVAAVSAAGIFPFSNSCFCSSTFCFFLNSFSVFRSSFVSVERPNAGDADVDLEITGVTEGVAESSVDVISPGVKVGRGGAVAISPAVGVAVTGGIALTDGVGLGLIFGGSRRNGVAAGVIATVGRGV